MDDIIDFVIMPAGRTFGCIFHLFVRSRPWAAPVFRDLKPNAHRWPNGAAFSVTYEEKDWPHLKDTLVPTAFFGEDGWPLDFPPKRKGLSEWVKAYVQTDVPRGWQWYLDEPLQWERAEQNPQFLAELADDDLLLRALVHTVPAPQVHGGSAQQPPPGGPLLDPTIPWWGFPSDAFLFTQY